MIIRDLEEHLAQEGEHAIFTGTFNPSHLGHTLALRSGFEALPNLNSIAVIPHSWSQAKNPVEITTRVKWLIQTIEEFASDLVPRVVVCEDQSILEEPGKLDQLCNSSRHRIHRIVGNDKITNEISGRNEAAVLSTQRCRGRNSTNIRDSIKTGDIEQVRGFISSSVLADILANDHYL